MKFKSQTEVADFASMVEHFGSEKEAMKYLKIQMFVEFLKALPAVHFQRMDCFEKEIKRTAYFDAGFNFVLKMEIESEYLKHLKP